MLSGVAFTRSATLGIGPYTNKSLVLCNVGNKSPVLMRVLLPEKSESCHLELEFEEVDDVVFSVIGPRSAHLIGYYVGRRHIAQDDDSDTLVEDIGNADTGRSSNCSDDSYEDSSINDDEVETSSPSGDSYSEETKSEPPNNGRPGLRRLKKQHQSKENKNQRTISTLRKSKKALDHGASVEDKVVEAGKTVGTDNKNADKSKSTNNGTTSRHDEESEDNKEVKPGKKKRKEKPKEKKKDTRIEDNADEHLSSERIIKKKRRRSNNENIEAETPTSIKQERNTSLLENGETNSDSNASKLIKMPNGLVIEDLVVGEADHKIASSGKKVTNQYNIKLKDGGRIVRSSIESAPHKFPLGMRVGGRRRLVIPPALGFGSEDNDLGVPPNSWLVIDVDLICVRQWFYARDIM
ncbi:Peptidyl-prolyl cis-trans isomerase FKBP43-like protein [Drosera capensis]